MRAPSDTLDVRRGAGSRPDERAAPGAPRSGPWLVSARADFWCASAGGGALLVALGLVLAWHGDRELAAADLLLGELHLGATYAAIARRRLWRHMPLDVLAVPALIVAATYVAVLNDRLLALTTAVLVLGTWHRGRQSLGIARHYQRLAGGPVSPAHGWLLSAAVYLPMVAALAHFASAAPDYEGDAFYRLALDPDVPWVLAMAAGSAVSGYLGWTVGRTAAPAGGGIRPGPAAAVHPAERWLVVANALAFAGAYVVGAWRAPFVLVLAVHHEVQYLYFTYALARQADAGRRGGIGGEARRLARFAVWPVAGLASWAACSATGSAAIEPFLTGGLLAHYWLDGRIWTARARRLASRSDRPRGLGRVD